MNAVLTKYLVESIALVTFLCRGLHDAIFWIFFFYENSDDNTPMILVVAK